MRIYRFHRLNIIGHVYNSQGDRETGNQDDREGAPLPYTRRWNRMWPYRVGAHPRGRPGIILTALPLLLLALLLAACGGSSSAPAQATPRPSPTPDQGEQVLAKAGTALNGARTLHALLNIGITGSAFTGTVNAEVWSEPPGKNRTVVLQSTLAQLSSGEITVSNGQQVWQYDTAKKVVYTAKLNGSSTNNNTGQDTSQFLIGLVRSILSSSSQATLVTSSASVKGHAVYDVHVAQNMKTNGAGGTSGTGATPGASDAQFSYTGDAYLDKTTYLPVEVVLTIQGFGQATIDFPTLQLNQPVSEQLFTFVPPAGVKVLPFPSNTGETGSLTLAQAQQQAGYHLLSIPASQASQASQAVYALQSVNALGAPGNQIYTLNYLFNGSTPFTISEGKALANLPASGQPVKVRGANGTIAMVGSVTTLSWTENGVGIQIAGALSSAQLQAIAGLLA